MDTKSPLSVGWICVSVSVLCLAASSTAVAQDAGPRVEWEKTFGGAGRNVGNAVQQTSDGGYIVAGYTESFGAGSDAFLMKLDEAGELDRDWGGDWPWNPKTFGGVSFGAAYSIQQTSDGGYIVAGSTAVLGARRSDGCLIKLDEHGELDRDWGDAWPRNPRTLDGASFAYAVRQTADGGYIVAGSTVSFGAGNHDVYLIKLDENGELDPDWGDAWPENPRTFGGRAYDLGLTVQQTSDGGYVVAGYTESFGAGGEDVYLIKLDARGELDAAWGDAWPANPKTFGGGADDRASSVQETSDGGYIVAGSTRSFGDAWFWDAYLIKLGADGELDPAWPTNPKTFFGARVEHDWASSVQQTRDGGYIVTGSTGTFGVGYSDLYLLKLDEKGELDPAWGAGWPYNPKTFGGRADDHASSVQQTSDGGYIVVGKRSFEPVGSQRADAYVIKLGHFPTAGFSDLCPSTDIAPWSSSDVGEPAFPGSAGFEGEGRERCLRICARGEIITSASDEFHFVYQQVTGDVTITAQVSELTGGERPKVGVMLRESLEPEARHAVMLIDGKQDRFRFLRRERTGERNRVSSGDSTEIPNAWVRIQREGNEFIGLSSTDGTEWTEVGRATLDLPGGVLAGIAATERDRPDKTFNPLVARVCELEVLEPARPFLRGDCNLDGDIDLADAVCTLNWLFAGAGAPGCVAATNSDGDDVVNLTDPTYLLLHLFAGGPAPVAPFPECGPGALPADAALGCADPPNC